MAFEDDVRNMLDSEENIETDGASLKEKCRFSLLEFTKEYIWNHEAEDWDNLSEFHFDICTKLENTVLRDKKIPTKTLEVSPRGHQKSFWTDFAFPIWCIAYKHTQNILIVSSEGSLGRQLISDIMQFIEMDEKFIEDFGDMRGRSWSTEKLICNNGVCLSSKGAGMASRGTKINGIRPTIIICDDILSEKNSNTSEQRQKTEDWYNKVLVPCGEKNCSIFVIGTILNDACLLYKMLTDVQYADYDTKKYQAVKKYSESDLWNEWELIRNNLEDEQRIKHADEYYHKNKEEMIKNTEVLWNRNGTDTYYSLMKTKASIGDDAWATEYMNDGLLEESREIKEEWIQRDLYKIEDLPEIVDVFIGFDAAAKAGRKNDDSAIVVVGKGTDNYYYVLEAWAKKLPIDKVIDQLILYVIQYYDVLRYVRVEDVVFQILLKDIIEKKGLEQGIYIPVDPIKPPQNKDKAFKLRSLIFPIRNGWLKMLGEHKKLIEEMRRFPKGASDNLLDALWIATVNVWSGTKGNAGFGFGGVETQSSKQHKNGTNFKGFFINKFLGR